MVVEHNFDLTSYNNYRIKAICTRAFFPKHEDDFINIYKNNTESKKIILGGGYNIILSKDNYKDDFLLIGKSFSKVSIEGEMIIAEAGSDMKDLSEIALSENLSGLEIFYDIPSSLGGAVVMNAGAGGIEIKDVLVKVRYLDLSDFTIKEIDRENIGFSYRNSFFQNNTDKIILKVWMRLESGDPKEIRKKMEDIKSARWAKQPNEFPNAGSVFKRPEGFYVGTMIEELGLKGYSIGGAQVSKKHAGFIINFNNASGKDILNLIEEIRHKVSAKYGVNLEVEQRII